MLMGELAGELKLRRAELCTGAGNFPAGLQAGTQFRKVFLIAYALH